MIGTSNTVKLAELRAKTDRQLVSIVEKEVELGLDLALVASPGLSTDFRLPESPHRRAEKSYARSAGLLRVVEDVMQRQRLQRKLQYLREMLDGRRVHTAQRA